MRAIVAEDEAVVGQILARLLADRGHETVVAADGETAWRLFNEEPARIILSDWVMPNLTGPELCARVRTRPKTDYCYFIMLTAVSGEENMQQAMAAGVDDFLLKPVNEQQLSIRLQVAERILGFMTQINRLESLLPICSYCRRIRDERDQWTELETYVREKSGANFSHGICPRCMEKRVAERATRQPHPI